MNPITGMKPKTLAAMRAFHAALLEEDQPMTMVITRVGNHVFHVEAGAHEREWALPVGDIIQRYFVPCVHAIKGKIAAAKQPA